MAKQLSLPERIVIEQMIHKDYSFASIGRNLDKTPFDLMDSADEKKLLSALNLSPIPPDEVILSPKLIKH